MLRARTQMVFRLYARYAIMLLLMKAVSPFTVQGCRPSTTKVSDI